MLTIMEHEPNRLDIPRAFRRMQRRMAQEANALRSKEAARYFGEQGIAYEYKGNHTYLVFDPMGKAYYFWPTSGKWRPQGSSQVYPSAGVKHFTEAYLLRGFSRDAEAQAVRQVQAQACFEHAGMFVRVISRAELEVVTPWDAAYSYDVTTGRWSPAGSSRSYTARSPEDFISRFLLRGYETIEEMKETEWQILTRSTHRPPTWGNDGWVRVVNPRNRVYHFHVLSARWRPENSTSEYSSRGAADFIARILAP